MNDLFTLKPRGCASGDGNGNAVVVVEGGTGKPEGPRLRPVPRYVGDDRDFGGLWQWRLA